MKQIFACLLALLPTTLNALPFDGAWREQGFLRLFSNDYLQKGTTLEVISDGTVSLLWRAVPEADRGAQTAAWGWSVNQSVPATDLSKKGGDDRNLALYFVFMPPEVAATANPDKLARLLRNPETHALVYVWGGEYGRNEILDSPYHPRLRTILKRNAGRGSYSESVDLAADYQRAFGSPLTSLVGVGITADSDDTNSEIRASVSNLTLK